MYIFMSLLKNDIRLFLKDWKSIVLLLAMPFLFISLFVYSMSSFLDKSSFMEPFPIAIVDREDTVQTRILANQLEGMKIFREILKVNEDTARQMIAQNRIAAAIIIPEEFSASIAVGENKPVTVIGNRAMPLQSLVVKTLVQSAANLVSAGQSAINTIYYFNEKAGIGGGDLEQEFYDSTARLLIKALARNEIFADIDTDSVLDLTPAEYFTSALLVIFVMFAGMPAMKQLVTERSTGITARLEASPVKVWQIVASKFAISAVISVLQFLIIITLTSIAFRNYWGGSLKSFLILFFSILTAVSSWSIFVAAVSKSPASADVIGNLGILLMAVTGGGIYPLVLMPEFVRKLSFLTINRWAMNGLMVLLSGDNSLSVISSVYALLGIGAGLLILSVAVMKLRKSRGWGI